ncbi:MAG: glutamine synthetase beta-grasp domain-containing protein [Candidatus Parvarchaeota archaeon]|nr:glutamine synthetase beta-grasp domain-containing protein [Candidatus Jingweiarchaeum tengchongense]MCW1298532.1 glutamine synthetase beta-grasp domain-containing protein [Candidatus Jingweiarchaeum tengchongense]MCW1300222.1 glutamine synthetase beta-grasp domain-containing protein [Candidatus Jingweiarchaeum tengchongense]MCW1304544.1 glutamine synthetase beta-grasp domain-containing protein [Candidatus Jingweiarchaeum tengchongense]MCW1305728.1 glutamine synthetase beta-grasp domain-conta
MLTKYARIFFVDINGMPRNLIVPYKNNPELIGFDGSSVTGFKNVEKSDMFILPDLNSSFHLPWDKKNVISFFASLYNTDSKTFECDTRSLLKEKLKEFDEQGYRFNFASELEFFLLKENNGKYEIVDKGLYCDVPPFDGAEKFKYDFMNDLQHIGFEIEKAHHEVANSQHEVAFKYDDALKTADKIILYKITAKYNANKHGFIASFMPKVFDAVNGSGAHVHVSVKKNNRNLFAEDKEFMENFIGGIMKHSKALSLIVNPTVNSYKRLVPGYEAPCYISWGRENRSCLIRVPAAKNPCSLRIEYRQPDPSFNPYLAFLAIISAGMDGVENKIKVGKEMNQNVYKLSENERRKNGISTLPANLEEAINEFEADDIIKKSLGNALSNKLIKIKRDEWNDYLNSVNGREEDFRKKVTDWERERYLIRC